MYTSVKQFNTLTTFRAIEMPLTKCKLSSMEWYDRVREIMKIRQIKAVDLIDTFGVTSRSAVGHYLSGRRQPTPAQLKALARKLKCSLDYIMNNGEIDEVQSRIYHIMIAAEQAMRQAKHPLSEEERLSVYRAAFAAGLEKSVTDEQIQQFLSNFASR